MLRNCLVAGIALFIVFSSFSINNFVNADGTKNGISINSTSDNVSNPYWGCPDIKLTNGTGYFDTHQDENCTWWFVTPDGYAFYSVGVNAVSPEFRYVYNVSILKKYGDYSAWANATVERFKEWGYNTLGAWSKYDLFKQVPYTYTFISRRNVQRNIARVLPDVFDPLWQAEVKAKIENFTQILKNDSYLIGYWLDNEINWGPDSFDDKTLLEEYMTPPYEYMRPGKVIAVNFLIERYNGNVKEFNKAWKMNLKSFDELYDKTKLGLKGYTTHGRAKDDVNAFTRLVAQTYFNYTAAVVRKYDPNHLILGVRFHLEGTPREVIEECGKYCDIVSINYYRNFKFIYDPIKYFRSAIFGLIPMDKWMQRYYEISSKPLLVSEFCYTPGDKNIQVDHSSAVKFALIQKHMADYFEWYAQSCLKKPYIVGYHWFSYINKIANDVDNNCGLVDTYDNPYTVLTERMAEVNSKIYEIHKNSNN